MYRRNFAWVASALLLAAGVFSGCEDGSQDLAEVLDEKSGEGYGVIAYTLRIVPNNVAMSKGGRQAFTALLNGQETAEVKW